MKKSTLGAFPFLKPSTKKNPRLHTAVLLNPAEVDVAFKDYPSEVRNKLRGLWMLVGAVNGERYSAFKANAGNDIAARLTVFPTPAGAAYAVFACQLGVHQHRFLLPLLDSKVIELLAAENMESINIYLENAGEPDGGMLYNCPLCPEQWIPAQAMCRTIDHQKQDDFIQELPSVISEMLSLQLMPSLNAKEVCVVDVSVLLPRDEPEGRLSRVQGDSGCGTNIPRLLDSQSPPCVGSAFWLNAQPWESSYFGVAIRRASTSTRTRPFHESIKLSQRGCCQPVF